MPLPIVNSTLFNAQGLAATVNEPHAQPGNHLRINAHPLLGLPVAPFIIWRAVVNNDEGLKLQDEVVFRDDLNRLIEAPFTLTEDRPVTAVLSLGQDETCIWAQVIADPLGGPDNGGGMQAEAYISSAQGPVPVARRDDSPFSFHAPGIVEIRLTGRAAVVGVRWLVATDIPHASFEPWTVLNLPHEAGLRYASVVSPIKECIQRVRLQAPKRRPLQDVVDAVAPGGAPFASEADEMDRVESLIAPLNGPLSRLITDTSAPPLEQREQSTAFDENGTELGTMDMSRLDSVYQAQFDPGTATYYGYKGLDTDFVENSNTKVFYWIEGYFKDFFPPPVIELTAEQDEEFERFDTLINSLPPGHRIGDQHKLISSIEPPINQMPSVDLDPNNLQVLEAHSDYIGLGTLIVVDRAAPPLPPRRPTITRNEHIDWIPVAPPDVLREAQVDLADIETGALLAAKKRNLPGNQPFKSLNKVNEKGFHLPLVLAINTDDETQEATEPPSLGTIADRSAEASDIRYFVSQQDRFGRWSHWTSGINRQGDRPLPPIPVLQAYYTQPDNPVTDPGQLFGKVAVPTIDALAPASFALQQLDIDVSDLSPAGTSQSLSVVIPDPLSPPDELPFVATAPMLEATEQRQVRLLARWVDTDGQQSPNSEPVVLTMTDPRPPAQLTVPDTLLYSGRPDITGLSLVEHTFTPAAGQETFGIYYSDENRLHAHLQSVADNDPSSSEATVLAAVDAATDIAARATLYRNNSALFDTPLFERLDNVVVDAPSGQKRFQHAVSGSLRVLNLYRISAESASNARVELNSLPLLAFAVPNADPPAIPVLTVMPGTMQNNTDTYTADITVSLVAGVTPAASYRLRRTSLGAADVLRIPVVETGVMQVPDDEGNQFAATTDSGPVIMSPTATLKPWVRYQWVAEVQGANAPGSGINGTPVVPGIWSKPSEPVGLVLTPPQAPATPTGFSASGIGFGGGTIDAVELTFDHAEVLSGGEAGTYHVRIYRRLPEGRLESLPDVPVAGHGPFSVSGLKADDGPGSVVSGTLYRLQIIDPLGRASDAVEATLI